MEPEPKKLFFSIIIPAHNEEKYIAQTLEHIKGLDYPKDKFEVIVVENGSSDNTYFLAKKFENKHIKVTSISRSGVSRAKNYGIRMLSQKSDWTIILDADTHIKKNFLSSINEFLLDTKRKSYIVGTTYVFPIYHSLKAKIWFRFYDFSHRITKTSYSIQLIKTHLIKKFKFNENLSMGEDLELIKFARKQGKFFVFKTKEVFTSTRRFEGMGWFNILIIWTFVSALPKIIKKRFSYKVVR